MRCKRGFTLVELIAVIVILAILLIILIPSVTKVSVNSKESLRDSKLRTIVTAGEEYGNDSINNYQNCLGSLKSSELAESCTVTISKLVNNGYVEGEDDEGNIIDPVTNRALVGKVLLCYNPAEVNVYGYYVEDEDNYSCKEISVNSDNTLNLSSIGGVGYVGGDDVEINIIKSGTFTGFRCRSSSTGLATCTVKGNDEAGYKLSITPTSDHGIVFSESFKNVDITLYGDYTGSDGTASVLSKTYTLKVYPTALKINDDGNVCLKAGTTTELDIEALNAGTLSATSTDLDILEGVAKDGFLYISAKNKTGTATLTIKENNGHTSSSIDRTVYNLQVGAKTDMELPEALVIHKEQEVSIEHGGTGNITITSDDPDIVHFKASGVAEASTITITDQTSFTVVANKTGNAKISIKGSDCGLIESDFSVSNIALSSTSALIYVGGDKATSEITIDEATGLACSSSDEEAATCTIEATTLQVFPGTKANDDVTITVRSQEGGYASMKVQVLATSLEIINSSGDIVDTVCTEKGSGTNSERIYARGINIGDTEVYEIEDWYLADVTMPSTGTIREISPVSRDVIEGGAIEPYVAGYNTGRTRIDIKESNGNKIASFYYNIYDLSFTSQNASLKVDESTTFTVNASGTGELSVTSSNANVASATISGTGNFNTGPNASNTRVVTVNAIGTGTATITVRGSQCGAKTFNVAVTGKVLSINLEPGTYSTGVGASKISCQTTGRDRSCNATFPEIYTTDEFDVVGYSTVKDDTSYTYRPGDTITINNSNNGTTYYGNSSDTTSPVCSILSYSSNTVIGETSYMTLTCVDTGSGINGTGELSVSDFTSTDYSIGSVVEVSEPTPIEYGYSYRVGIKSTQVGVFEIMLKTGSVVDKFGNVNSAISLKDIFSSEYTAEMAWYIGKDEITDVIAVLYNNVDYKGVDDSTYTLFVYGKGDMLDFMTSEYPYYPPWYADYKLLITDVVINSGITNIGSGFMYNAQNLTNATFSEGITYIGANSFSNCNLSSIVFPSSVTWIGENAFYQNTGLSKITLNDGLQTIEDGAFYNHNASSIAIPASVTSVGEYSFGVEQGNEVLENLTFLGDSSLTVIESGAFAYHKITTLEIPSLVTTIGDYAFASSDSISATLESVTFSGNSLETLGDYAFSNNRLGSITLPESLKTIGSGALTGLREGVTSITIGANVQSIGDNFAYGKDLREFIVDIDNAYYTAIDGVLYTKDLMTLVKCPDDYYKEHTTLDVPNSVTTLQKGAFTGWLDYGENITGFTLNLPSDITNLNIEDNFIFFTIGAINISGNSQYESIDGVLFDVSHTTIYRLPTAYDASEYSIPETVTKVADYFSYGNSRVGTITVPGSVTSIGSMALLADPTYAFSIINLNAESSITFDETSFGAMVYSEGDAITDKTKTINVKDSSLKAQIEDLYRGVPYTLSVNLVS